MKVKCDKCGEVAGVVFLVGQSKWFCQKCWKKLTTFDPEALGVTKKPFSRTK